VFGAHALKIPCIAHESDFSPGLANRLSASRCKTVFTSFPETAKKLRHGKYSGAPMRSSLTKYTKSSAIKALSIPLGAKVLLILGGGSGSKTVNEAVFNNLKILTAKYYVLHICGKGNLPVANFKNYRAFEYFSDIGLLYAAADLVVSRAGAGALFELLALRKPTLFIPLAGATRGDQTQNAEYFLSRGLCHLLPQKDVQNLPTAIDELYADAEVKSNLLSANFTAGNAVIVRALREWS
jgi:UDP-N-acetylglucosamine--N-acetylmuramyl-(pentapeptide) pyrophosphoryl-undecaprenol N-acetylglucosamine transferase